MTHYETVHIIYEIGKELIKVTLELHFKNEVLGYFFLPRGAYKNRCVEQEFVRFRTKRDLKITFDHYSSTYTMKNDDWLEKQK